MVASLLVVLPRPGTWVVALAAFLLRGGILLFLVPILVLPSPVGVATILGPTITAVWLGGLSLGFAAIVAAIFMVFFAWLVIGGWIAAVTERDLVRVVAADDEIAATGVPAASGSRRRGRIWRIVLLRLAGHIPLGVALGYGSLRLVQATYRELTLPGDVLVPIAWRVIASVPDVVLAIAAAWTVGEILGSLGARRIVLWGQSLDRAYVGAWADLVRRPVAILATFLVPAVVIAAATVPIVLGAGVAWNTVRVLLAEERPENGPALVVSMLAFVAIWATGLLVAGVLGAWRSAAWTVEVLRVRGTFGVPGTSRPGEWNGRRPSGTV